MNTPHPKESTHFTLLPFWGGVEMLTATFSRHSFSRHVHEDYAVGCIEQGALRFRYQGENLTAAAGQINMVVPGQAHDGHSATETGWSYRMFYIKPEGMREATQAMAPRSFLPDFRKGVLDDPALSLCLASTHTVLESNLTSALEKETRLLWFLAHWIDRHAESEIRIQKSGREHRAVHRAEEYLMANYADDVSLDHLARDAGLSPFHLIRVFRQETGLTPHTYLTQVRTEAVREQLSSPRRMVDIAANTGFADQSHMTREFKRRFGLTPGKYRNILQNN